ncbi:MAG: hypothetical protein ACIPMY_06930 [Rickettsia endosymbiont of Pentastiridius leporinus]
MRIIFIIFLLLFVTSCNLKPVYDTRYNSKINKDLEAIEVEPIKTIEGAEFYYRLTSILPGQGKAKYLLKAELTAAVMPATIEKNSDVSRQYINQLIKYKLINIETSKILIEEKFYQTTSYNSIFTPYATNIERDETGIDLAHAAAEEIHNRLILYFTRNNNL